MAEEQIKKRIKELSELSFEEVLDQPLKNNSLKESLKCKLANKAEDLSYVGLTLGDTLYDYLRVDPLVIKGCDFVRTEDLSNIFSFSNFATNILNKTPESIKGNISNLQGYVAEQFAAQNLQSMGHEVDFPETSNQAGFDLFVDGSEVQVKCVQSAQEVMKHLDRYPDIPVIVNAELASKFTDNDMVFPLENMSHSEIVGMTESSLESAKEFLDFEIPMISLAVSGGKQIYNLIKDRTSLEGALLNTGFDTTGRFAGANIGKYIGGTAGLILGPYGAVIGSISGTVVGAKAGKLTSDYLKKNLFCQKEEEIVFATVVNLCQKCIPILQNKIEKIRSKSFIMEEQLLGKNTQIAKTLWKKYDFRLEQEIQFFKDKKLLLEKALKNPSSIVPSGDLLESTNELLFQIVNAKIPYFIIPEELRAVQTAVQNLHNKRTSLAA